MYTRNNYRTVTIRIRSLSSFFPKFQKKFRLACDNPSRTVRLSRYRKTFLHSQLCEMNLSFFSAAQPKESGGSFTVKLSHLANGLRDACPASSQVCEFSLESNFINCSNPSQMDKCVELLEEQTLLTSIAYKVSSLL